MRLNKASKPEYAQYKLLMNEYKKIGINWGISRCYIMCLLLNQTDKIDKVDGLTLNEEKSLQGQDYIIMNESNSSKDMLLNYHTFYYNIP